MLCWCSIQSTIKSIYKHFLHLLSNRQISKTVVQILPSENANEFKLLLRFIRGLKDSWSLVAQSKLLCPGCYVVFRALRQQNTGHNLHGGRYKAPGIFHRGLDYMEPDSTVAAAPD